MDPKNHNQLDPKLKEAYDRVMGTDLTSLTPPPQPVQPQAPMTMPSPPPPTPQPTAPFTAPQSAPHMPAPGQPIQSFHAGEDPIEHPIQVNTSPSAIPAVPSAPTPVFQGYTDSQASEAITNPATSPEVAKSKNKISPMILLGAGVVFFLIYAVLWGKIFGLF